jgi:hypothetical protein
MTITKETMKVIEGKLRRPVHISYISRYILKLDESETRNIMNKLIESDIIEESKYASDYYVLKNQNDG